MTVTQVTGVEGKSSAWQTAGTTAYDFRSDVVTRPTVSMLQAIADTTLLDDDFGEDPTTNALQEYIAKRTQHEAALLVLSGTMGNQLALRTHLTQPPYAVLCDHRAHIIHYEAGGVGNWTGAYIKAVIPKNGMHLTLEDVQKNVTLSEGHYSTPTRVISLENTLDGTIMPLEEVRRICDWAHEHEIKVHLDGARLWEAVASGAGSLAEYTTLFDSVNLCFSKGLGAPIGSIIVGSQDFITKARWFRKSIGGGTRQAGVISAAARVAVEETFGHGPSGEDGKLRRSHLNAKRIAEMWESRGGKLANPVQTNMVWLDIEAADLGNNDMEEIGASEGLKLLGNRLVVHYQISDDAIEKLGRVMDHALSGKFVASNGNGGEKVYGQR